MRAIAAVIAIFLSFPTKAEEGKIFKDLDLAKKILEKMPLRPRTKKAEEVLLAARNKNGEIVPIYINIDPRLKGPGSCFSTRPVGIEVQWPKLNGVNTPFQVIGHDLLALKRNRGSDPKSPIIYVPFTPTIDTEEVRIAGLRYLEATLDAAKERLRKLGVRSRAFPDKLIADVIEGEQALMLSIIEHIDPDRSEAEPIERLVNEVLAIVGANKDEAYRYSVSPKAKARGKFQFIKRTYAYMIKKYPSAKLERDFVKGMNDDVNAATASFLLFDNDLTFLMKRQDEIPDPSHLGRYLSAAYNGGAGRAAKALDALGKLEMDRLKSRETRVYVQKYEKVRRLMKEPVDPLEGLITAGPIEDIGIDPALSTTTNM